MYYDEGSNYNLLNTERINIRKDQVGYLSFLCLVTRVSLLFKYANLVADRIRREAVQPGWNVQVLETTAICLLFHVLHRCVESSAA